MSDPGEDHGALISPPALAHGQTIGIVTVSAPEPHLFPVEFQRGLDALSREGYDLRLARHANASRGYMAAPEHELAEDLHEMFSDPSIAGVICAGGGTNANRLLRHLDFDLIRSNPKVFVGVSNPTVLINAVMSKARLITFHGPSVVWDWGSRDRPEWTAQHFRHIVAGEAEGADLSRFGLRWLKEGAASGPLVGGNLSSLRSLIGTPWEPEWSGRVLIWEDVGEDVEHLDAALTHFRDAGILTQLRGMIVGKLVDCEPSRDWGVEQMMSDLLGEFDFPIAVGIPFGHTPLKFTVPLGVTVELDSVRARVGLRGPAVVQP